MILEIGKNYVQKFYNGNLQKAVEEKDGTAWTLERIQGAFNGGNGTEKDLQRYMSDNRRHAYFVEV